MDKDKKWEALSMRDRAFLIRQAVRNGITDINSIKNLYVESQQGIKLGVPYKTFEAGSDYDYYNAAPENMPAKNSTHWTSRNPHTGQLLKSPNHPTYDMMIDGERGAGFKIEQIGDREYSFPIEHRFDGKSNNSTDNYIETDVNHSRDGSWIERLAYNIGSTPKVKDSGEATLLDGDILLGVMNTMVGRQPYNYPDLKAFLGHPEDVGYEKTDDNTGPQFTNALHKYPKGSIQTYKGTINPYNEYVVTDDDYNRFVDMAQRGEIFYSNADLESFGLSSDTYRDDVGNYPIQFVMEDGELYANAADLYDFNISNWQGRLLTKYGNPYIRRQNKIPVRKIALPEDLLDMPFSAGDSIDGIPITDEMKRAKNMHKIVKRNAPHLFSGLEKRLK